MNKLTLKMYRGRINYIYQEYRSPVGTLCIISSGSSLYGIFYKQNFKEVKLQFIGIKKGQNRITNKVIRQLEEYFVGKRRKFDLPIKFLGTSFQKKAWSELLKIQYGETISYKQQALNMRHPRSVRAVGSSNGRNRFSIVVPCHRVIANNGSLGGYAGGRRTKRLLLDLEKRNRPLLLQRGL